jgi:hypothetical protein
MRLTVTGCAGKRIPTTFTEMAKRVRGGTTVYVTTADGKEERRETGFDMLHHRRVFRGTSSRRGASLFIAPVLTAKVWGVRVSSGF